MNTTKTRIILETDIEGDDDRGRALHALWERRRETPWCIRTEREARITPTHPTSHVCTLDRVAAGERDGSQIAVGRLSLVVETRPEEDALTKAMRILDLPGGGQPLGRAPVNNDRVFGPESHLEQIAGEKVIATMPHDWPTGAGGRRITDYSHHLGSYGQGGVGLSGWQINGGSWMVLPLKGSDGWITLTHETMNASPDRQSVEIVVDQRVIGVHPDQIADFPPWQHNYGGHDKIDDLPTWRRERLMITRFEAEADGFVIEAGDTHSRWRFAVSPALPRPIFAGSKKERLLYEGEDIGASFILTHDCYLDV